MGRSASGMAEFWDRMAVNLLSGMEGLSHHFVREARVLRSLRPRHVASLVRVPHRQPRLGRHTRRPVDAADAAAEKIHEHQ